MDHEMLVLWNESTSLISPHATVGLVLIGLTIAIVVWAGNKS